MVNSFFRRWLAPFLLWVVYRLLLYTWKVTVEENDSLKKALQEKTSVIFSHWHGDEIPLLHLISRYRIATIVSQSKDGEMMNRLISFLGGQTVRGSSTRGGVQALKGLIRICKKGANISFAVDGPKGPIYQVKPGVFEVSRVAQLPIYAGGVYCDRAWRFHRSWNQSYLPKPFAKIHIVWKGPFGPVGRDENPKQTNLKLRLEDSLHQAQEKMQECNSNEIGKKKASTTVAMNSSAGGWDGP